MPPSSKGSRSSSVPPGQPSQAPWLAFITGISAETRPPGERRHEALPCSSTTRSTGSRLATTTRSAPCCLRLEGLTSPPYAGRTGPTRGVGLAGSWWSPSLPSVVPMTHTLTQRLDMTADDTAPLALVPGREGWWRRLLLDTGYTLTAFPIALLAFVVAVVGLSVGAATLVIGVGFVVL